MTKRVLYFTAGPVPTVTEAGQIAALVALGVPGYTVGVRSALLSGNYGAGIEASDYVAGTIPTAFNAVPNYGVPDVLRPAKLKLLSATGSFTVAVLGTAQLQAISVVGADISALTVADVTAVTTTYASSAPLKATVDANGLVTGVAAGTTTITATHTYAVGKTITATAVITVPA